MNPNPSKAELDEENYQVEHGSKSLAPFIDLATFRLVVIKHHDAEKVLVVDVEPVRERVIDTKQFEGGFSLFILDEMVFYSGNQHAIDGATRTLRLIDAARKFCLYGKAQVPALVGTQS